MDDDNGWRNTWPFRCHDDAPHAWKYNGDYVPGKPWSKHCLNCFMVKAGNTTDNDPAPADLPVPPAPRPGGTLPVAGPTAGPAAGPSVGAAAAAPPAATKNG